MSDRKFVTDADHPQPLPTADPPGDVAPHKPPAGQSTLHAAIEYTLLGWSAIPVPHRSKNPGYKGWEQTRLTEPDLPVVVQAGAS